MNYDLYMYILHLSRGVRPPPNVCLGYDTKQSDGEDSVILELWGMQSIPLLPSLSDLLCLGVVAPDMLLCIGQIELNCVLMPNWIVYNRTILTFKLCIYVKHELVEIELLYKYKN